MPYIIRPAIFAPVFLTIFAIYLAIQVSGWFFLSLPFIWLNSLCAQPNINLADGCLAYLSILFGFVLIFFFKPIGLAILFGALLGFYFSAFETLKDLSIVFIVFYQFFQPLYRPPAGIGKILTFDKMAFTFPYHENDILWPDSSFFDLSIDKLNYFRHPFYSVITGVFKPFNLIYVTAQIAEDWGAG